MEKGSGRSWVIGVAILVVILVGVFLAMRSRPEAADPAQAGSPGESQIQPGQEPPTAQPPVRRRVKRVNRELLIGFPEDYDLTPEEFHQRRLSTKILGQPPSGDGPVDLPGFKYITLDRPINIDLNKVLPAGLDLYEAALDQKILTGAPFTIILRGLNAKTCPDFFEGAYWEPALPVPASIQSVDPPLVLKEQPAVQVLVDGQQPIALIGKKWCKRLLAKTENRFAGDVIFRFKTSIPTTKEKTDPKGIVVGFILTLE